MVWIVILRDRCAARHRADHALQPLRPLSEPRRQRVGADRGPAQAPVGPDPEPHRDGEGLRGARARHVRGGHRGARRTRSGRRAPPRPAAAEGILGAALGRLFAVAEAYPELQADENFRQLQDELAETENRIAVSRQVYNDTVLTYNNAIQTFPVSSSQARSTSRSASSSRRTRRSARPRRWTSARTPPPTPAAPAAPPAPPAEPGTGGAPGAT